LNCSTWIQFDQKGRLIEQALLETASSSLVVPERNRYQFQKKAMDLEDVKKYFLHGLVFSILMFAIIIGWIFVLAFLIVIGSIIGLILGLVMLVFLIGWLNVKLTRIFWHFEAGSEWTELMLHGVALLLALLMVSIPQLLISWLIPSPITTILLFIVYCFVDGYVAKNLAIALF
jgi:hypothetical protein